MSKLDALPLPALLAGVYILWTTLGAACLLLPAATHTPISWSDAFFTATSAVTVTGLVVVDTGRDFTYFGQAIIMVLIQLGGMGLMTFAVMVLSSLGLQIGLAERQALREEVGLKSIGGILDLVAVIFRVVIVFESLGIILLAFVFVPEFGWADGLWQSLFHSVSAFNNAGFSLFSDSLMGYADEPLILLTIAAQFVIGGLGFAVLSDVFVLRSWTIFSLHTRLMLAGTAFLIIVSFSCFALLEWNNPMTLGSLDGVDTKLVTALFESLSPRTAGFNSLDTSALSDATSLLMMVLMVVGGGSTSTAGGIKVTTAVVLLLATLAFFRNSGRMRAFGYSVGLDQGLKVMALLSVSLMIVITGLFLIILTHDLDFLVASFEVVSAFGTVGLSQGATDELSDLGRAIISVIMFLGRLGPLTLGFFLATKSAPRVKYPEGKIFLG